jgi:hypothetical protein
MPKYRKTFAVDAFQFKPVWRTIGACADNAPIWFLQAECDGKVKVWGDDEVPYCMIQTLEGAMKAEAGDWIIRGIAGEIHPCRADIFAKTYEVVE